MCLELWLCVGQQPLHIRAMFKNNKSRSNRYHNNLRRVSFRNPSVNSGKKAAAVTDARDTNRNAASIITNTAIASKTAFGVSRKKEPRPVATPLPPRKRSQIGNMWPLTAASAATNATVRLPGQSAIAIPTAASPFTTSRTSVRTPSFGDVRATFVAPIFPLPVVRTSAPRNARTSK